MSTFADEAAQKAREQAGLFQQLGQGAKAYLKSTRMDEETKRLADDLNVRAGRSDEFIQNELMEGVERPEEAQALGSQVGRGLGMDTLQRSGLKTALDKRLQSSYGQRSGEIKRDARDSAADERLALQKRSFDLGLEQAKAKAQAEYQTKMRDFQNKQARSSALGSILGGVGAVAGAFIGGPAGAMAGGQLGQKAGSDLGQSD